MERKGSKKWLLSLVMVFALLFSTVGSAFALDLNDVHDFEHGSFVMAAAAGAQETNFDTHTKDDFGSDGVCTKHTDSSACGYSLTDYQTDCTHAAAPAAGGTCDTCGKADVPEHAADFASHSKDSFDSESKKCTLRSDCAYTLETFQEQCTNETNHNTIASGQNCDVCGFAGTYVAPEHNASSKHSFADYVKQDDGSAKCKVKDCTKTLPAEEYQALCPDVAKHTEILKDQTCEKCGYVGVKEVEPAHTHDWAEEWTNDETSHWHDCNAQGCDVTDKAQKNGYGSHDWAEKNGTCKVCSMDCPAKADHANILTTATCPTCGASGTMNEADHTHDNWATEWSHDDTNHWHACQETGCEVKKDTAPHDTDGADGACSECGYKAAPPAHNEESEHAFADYEKQADGSYKCKVEGCEKTLTAAQYQDLCPNKAEHANILSGSKCETCEFAGTKHDHVWNDGVCSGEGICPGCSLKDGHDTLPKGETCTECGLVGTYLDPIDVVMNATMGLDEDGSLTATVEADAMTSAIDTARGDDSDPAAPVRVTINMVSEESESSAAKLTLKGATVAALVTASQSEGDNGQSIEAPVTLNLLSNSGIAVFPLEALVMAQDGDDDADVVVDMSDVVSDDVKGQLTPVKDDEGNDVYKDDQGEVVDIDSALAVDVSLLVGSEAATIEGLESNIKLTLAAPEGATTVKVYYVGDSGLVTVDTVKVVDGKVSFEVDHLTTFVLAEAPDQPEHSPTFSAHDKTSFNDDGSCKTEGCEYTKTQFQTDCNANGGNHANILTTETCGTCGAPGTKSTGSGGGSGSGGSSSKPDQKPEQKPDTSVTTDPETGATIETTKNPDGSSTVVTTQKDGTKTTVNTDASGKSETTVEVSKTALEAAAGDPVKLPMKAVAVSTSENSMKLTVKVEGASNVKVAVPATGTTPGTVMMIVNSDGTMSVVKNSVVSDGSVVATVPNGTTVRLVDRSKNFADMSGHWADGAVAFVSARDLFDGTAPGTFSPTQPMTRAMLVTVLARYEGVNTTGGDTWYAKSVEWAKQNGISDGLNINDNISREQLVTMLWRYSGAEKSTIELNAFSDAGQVSSYAQDAMCWAVEHGVIRGYTNGTIGPKGQATRAEVAQIFQNYVTMQ